jgi:hypothetical protein
MLSVSQFDPKRSAPGKAGKEEEVEVPHGEGLANRLDPE